MLPKMLAFERLKSSSRGFLALVILGKSLNKGLFRRFGAGSLVLLFIDTRFLMKLYLARSMSVALQSVIQMMPP